MSKTQNKRSLDRVNIDQEENNNNNNVNNNNNNNENEMSKQNNEPPKKKQRIDEEGHHHHRHHHHDEDYGVDLWRPHLLNEMFSSPIDRYVKSVMENALAPLNNISSTIQPLVSSSLIRSFRSDMVELENEYQVHADLPGVQKQNINVNFKEGKLEIECKRENVRDEWTENHHVHHQEVSYGTFYRTYHLPKSRNIAPSDVKAQYENGVLTIRVPKPKEEKENKSHSVRID